MQVSVDLSKYAEANAFNTSGAHNDFPRSSGLRPPAPFGEGWPEVAPIMCCASIKALASAYFKITGHPFFVKHWPSTFYKRRQALLALKASL